MIQLAGVHNPEQAAPIIGSTAQLELYDLEPALVPPSVTVSGTPVAHDEPLPAALARRRRPRRTASRAAYVLFKPVKVKSTTGTGKNKKTKTTIVLGEEGGPDATRCIATSSPGTRACSTRAAARCRRATRCCRSRTNTVVITCSAQTTAVCPGEHRPASCRRRARPTTTSSSTARTRTTSTARTRT